MLKIGLIFTGVLLGAFLALAEEVSTSASNNNPDASNADTAIRPQLGFSLNALNYFSDSTADKDFQQNAEMRLGLKKNGFWSSEVDTLVGTFSEPKSAYFAVPQAYVQTGNSKNYLAVGRKVQMASALDQQYNLGLYNSFFTNDYLRYEEQGLTGLQIQTQISKVGFRLGWHPIYLPNQGPQVREENGEIVSSNRWAQRPPKQFQFADQDKNIEYVIRDYSVSDIITNSGEVVSVYFGDDEKRPAVLLSYAHKPLNDIPLTRETYGTVLDFVGHVALSPVVTYHEVKSADLNLDASIFKSTLSYIEDRPFNKVAAEDETLQYLHPLKIYGVSLVTDLTSLFDRKFDLLLAYAEVTGGEIKDLTQDGKESVFTFSTQRTQFQQPFTVGLSADLIYLGSKPLSTELKWIYDRKFKGSVVSGNFSYETIKNLNMNIGFDVLGVENSTTTETNFLSQNKANDRVYGGLQYVF